MTVDQYLKRIPAKKRKELERIRALAKKAVPDAEEVISYGMPTLKWHGKPFLGFDAHANHIGIYPYSGKVVPALKQQLSAYRCSSGAIQVPLDHPIPARLLKQVINCRLKAIKATPKQ
jgi:uncharacterized protein YdhG (YjbR/CyaY superfamily)